MTLGLWIASFPALLAAGATVWFAGIGRKGVGLGAAVGVGLIVLFAIGLPIDLLRARRSQRPRGP